MNVLFILGKRLFLTISKMGKDIRNPYIGALGIMFYFCRCKEMNRQTKKVLGNTRNLAHQVQELTGGDLFEIETVKAYPEKYRSCTEYAKKEKEADARPALKSKVKDMDAYDVVYVGFPNWWGTAPMAIWSFLEGYDLTGKTVIPFCTHGGGGEQKCFSDFARHAGKADLKEMLARRWNDGWKKSV